MVTHFRCLWMQKIIRSVTNVFPKEYTFDYMRAGWCYMKVGQFNIFQSSSTYTSPLSEIHFIYLVRNLANVVSKKVNVLRLLRISA